MDSLEQLENERVSLEPDGGENSNKSVEKSRQCPICHVYYKYGNSYWQHVRYVHASFLSQCVICEKCYKRTTMAKHHILHSHKIAWHLCGNYVRKIRKSDLQQKQDSINLSAQKANNIKSFKKKTLHLIRSFNCYDCPGSFTTIQDLFQHVKVHRSEHEVDVDEINELNQ